MRVDIPLITMQEGAGIEEKLYQALYVGDLKITTAESCTGGLLAGRIVNVPGASDVFERSFVTYANEAKVEELGVKEKTLEEHGAVSKQVAKQMAKGAAKRAKADVAISVTGIAGPDGGTEEKPVGLVYIGVWYQGKSYYQQCLFRGNRSEVRGLAVVNALSICLNILKNQE